MRNYLLSSMVLISSVSVADCDFKTGIKPQADGTYNYSLACHLKVGEIVRDLDISQKQLADLNLAIVKKDEALSIADQRISNLRDGLIKLDDKFSSYEAMKSSNEWLYFGLGIATVLAGAYTVNQINRH